MSAYEKVLLARAKDRPTGISYIENIFEDFIEPVSYTHLTLPTKA